MRDDNVSQDRDTQSPEVLGVRAQMLEGGVDFFLDVHGEEQVPFVFVAAAWGHPGLQGLYPLAAADLGLGLAHAAFWWPVRA